MVLTVIDVMTERVITTSVNMSMKNAARANQIKKLPVLALCEKNTRYRVS